MTINGSAQYVTANSFRRALVDRLKAEAKARGRSLDELRREFLFQRFLAGHDHRTPNAATYWPRG